MYYISMIPYSNMLPYRLLGRPNECDFIDYTPKQSVYAIKTGRVIAGAVPLASISLLSNIVEPIGNYGIAAEKSVGSVLLFSKYQLKELGKGKKIFLTKQSATSVNLLYLLLSYCHNATELPSLVLNSKDADAILLIGDNALSETKKTKFKYVIDLATMWYDRHHLPFVFARWVVRKDAPKRIKGHLLKWLNLFALEENTLLEKSAKFASSPKAYKENLKYQKGMQRVLNERHIKSQALFFKEFENLGGVSTINNYITNGKLGNLGSSKEKIRIEKKQALELLVNTPLGELMSMAFRERQKRYPDNLVTFVKDTNPNHTNICVTKCAFCAFCKDETDLDAYTLRPDELSEKVFNAEQQGASTVLFQGGHNPNLKLEDLLNYIRAIKQRSPNIHIHPFSPPEILFLSKKDNISVAEILKAIKAEGIDTIPGGGCEILVDSVRKKIAPLKYKSSEWLSVMRLAHQMGFRTTATMMYGHLETPENIVDHLLILRELQDETNGFSSFIPWSFKPGGSPLSKIVTKSAHPAYYVRIIALARLLLDNFDHIQSSWFSENENAGCLGLLAGADDFGGILIEENVLKTSGFIRHTSVDGVKHLIKNTGFTPALRDSHYRLLEVYNEK